MAQTAAPPDSASYQGPSLAAAATGTEVVSAVSASSVLPPVAGPGAAAAAPTSTWVVFEEVEPPLSLPLLREVRVQQAESDDRGPGYWFDTMSLPSNWRLEEEGIAIDDFLARENVVDLCRPSEGTGASEPRRVAELAKQAECPEPRGDDEDAVGGLVSCVLIRADGSRVACPKPEPEPEPVTEGEARWLVTDQCAKGEHGATYRTKHAAWKAVVQDRASWTLPHRARPLGFYMNAFEHLPCWGIEWAGSGSRPGQVEVLPGTVSVVGGTLRGLARNWSSTLWAWDVEVRAGTRSFAWPLTIQPGEVAGFEFAGWDGPSDPVLIEFGVFAEMSNDADLSRGFEIGVGMAASWICRSELVGTGGTFSVPDEVLDEFTADEPCLRQLWVTGRHRGGPGQSGTRVGLGGPSHPSMRGQMAPALIEDLRAYLARIDAGGSVVDLQRLVPFFLEGYAYAPSGAAILDDDGNRVVIPAVVIREYPSLDDPDRSPILLFPDPSPDTFVLWVGGAH